MISIFPRYIARTISMATALVALVITSVLFLILMLGELKNLGEGDYGILQMIWFVMLRLPNELYQFSPLLILLGCITGLGVLASHRELIVMRTAGFSIRQIMLSALYASLILMLSISLVGEWLGPTLSYKAEIGRENAQNADQAVITAAGVWLHLYNNFIHIQQVVNRQLLEGVTRYEFDDQHHLQAAYYAKTLSLYNKQWQMHNVVKTSFYNDRTKSQAFPRMNWNLKFNTNLLNIGLVEPSEMSLPRLMKFARYLEQNGLQAREYRYSFWQRVFQPFASLIMILLAVPFVLGFLGNVTLGWRIIMGMIVGFIFFILNALLGELCIVFQLPPLWAALLPLILFILIGALLVNRIVYV